MKVKLNLVEVQIIEKNIEIKLLFEKLELAISTILNGEVQEIITEGDSGIDANS